MPYAVGTYFHEWHRYPVLVRQYHSDLNFGIVLSQVPLAADVATIAEFFSASVKKLALSAPR